MKKFRWDEMGKTQRVDFGLIVNEGIEIQKSVRKIKWIWLFIFQVYKSLLLLLLLLLSRFSRVWLCNPIDGSPPGSPVLGFSRQEHWGGLPFLPRCANSCFWGLEYPYPPFGGWILICVSTLSSTLNNYSSGLSSWPDLFCMGQYCSFLLWDLILPCL